MVTDRELNAMMADGLLNTVRDAAKSLYGENQTYPCDDVKRMASEVERLRAVLEHLRAELNEHGGRYWEARYRDEAADNDRLRAALEKHETRFNHCSEMLEQSFNISGTLRAEYARRAHHYALEARAALGGDA